MPRPFLQQQISFSSVPYSVSLSLASNSDSFTVKISSVLPKKRNPEKRKEVKKSEKPHKLDKLPSLDDLAREMAEIVSKNGSKSSLLPSSDTEKPFQQSFSLTISKELASKITSKYHNISLLQLYRSLWDCFQKGTFQYIFTSSSRVSNDLHHGDWEFEDKMNLLRRENVVDADLLIMRFYLPQTKISFKKEFFLIFQLEKKEESVQEKLKRIKMKFSSAGGKTMELDAWKNYVALSKTVHDKVVMYAILLLGRVRDVTPKVMRKAYERFKALIDTLLNSTRGMRGALNQELAFFHSFKKKDRDVALIVSSWILFESNHRDEAQASIAEILFNSKPTQQLAFIYFTKARIEGNDPDTQLSDYTQCIDLFPIFPMAFVNRANLYHTHLKDGEKALKDLESARRLDPSWSVVYLNRGVLHKELFENYEQAQQDYNVAISCDEKNSVAFLNRALLYCSMGRYHMSLVDFNKAIAIDKTNALMLYNRGYVQHHHLREFEAAMNDYNAAIAENPMLVEAYFHRGLLCMQHEAHEEALVDFSRCIELNKNFTMAYYYRSLLYGTDPMALRDLEQAISRGGSSNPQVVFARGSLYEALGMFDQAMKDYNSCLLLDGLYEDALESKELLMDKIRKEKERRIPREDALLAMGASERSHNLR
mmetsp:Transcript_8403/g.31105  ORF Transcript_8403/g.31105 Transcript_8403/m.31105 type:complete len:652 (+) Transcript_8403:2582-4537(+)